jgi:hypothetical protein
MFISFEIVLNKLKDPFPLYWSCLVSSGAVNLGWCKTSMWTSSSVHDIFKLGMSHNLLLLPSKSGPNAVPVQSIVKIGSHTSVKCLHTHCTYSFCSRSVGCFVLYHFLFTLHQNVQWACIKHYCWRGALCLKVIICKTLEVRCIIDVYFIFSSFCCLR